MWSSQNGKAWSIHESGTSAWLTSLAFGNDSWVITGRDGIVLNSTCEKRPSTILPSIEIDAAIELRWQSEAGLEYWIQVSDGLGVWQDDEGPRIGNGGTMQAFRSRTNERAFFRVVQR